MRRPRSGTIKAAGLVVLACALAVLLGGCSVLHVQTKPRPNPKWDPRLDLSALGTDQPIPKVVMRMPLAGKVEPPPSGAFLGVYDPPAPFDLSAYESYVATVGRPAAIVMWYQPWASDNSNQFDPSACLQIMRRGAVPMITWEPWDPGNNANLLAQPQDQPAWALRQIIRGKYDAYIKSWADQIRDFGGPIMLRPMHEMNGTWYPWAGTVNGNSPQEYVLAWRHIHDIFQREGATNVTWVWSVNHSSSPDVPSNAMSLYYPGDSYVDWTALSGFNFGASLSETKWRSFWYWYNQPLAYLEGLHKPICLAEFGSVEQGGDKGAWILDAYAHIRQAPQVKAVIYFNSREEGQDFVQDWRVDTSPGSLAAFREAISPDYFITTPPDALTEWAKSLTTMQWRYLSTIPPVY